jgi:hypothetical protein
MKIKKQTIAELKLNEPLFYVEEVSDNNLGITVNNVINAVVNNEVFFTTYINKNNETIAQMKINKDYQVVFEEQELPIFVKLENAENYLNHKKELKNNNIKRIAEVLFENKVSLPLALQYRKEAIENKKDLNAKEDLLVMFSIPEFNYFCEEDFNVELFIEEYEKLDFNSQDRIEYLPIFIKVAIKDVLEKNNSTVDICLRLSHCYLYEKYNTSAEYVILKYLNEGKVAEKLNKIFFETYKENNYKL